MRTTKYRTTMLCYYENVHTKTVQKYLSKHYWFNIKQYPFTEIKGRWGLMGNNNVSACTYSDTDIH